MLISIYQPAGSESLRSLWSHLDFILFVYLFIYLLTTFLDGRLWMTIQTCNSNAEYMKIEKIGELAAAN